MTLQRMTAIALSPARRRKRESQQAERNILKAYATEEERRVYAQASVFYGYTLWDFLRELLARAYQNEKITFRDHCIASAALRLFSQQAALPAEIQACASNGGQFEVAPSDAIATAAAFERAIFASRIIGDFTKTDATAVQAMLANDAPEERRERGDKARRLRFIQRVIGYFGT